MAQHQTCVDCGKSSPATETDYTLISSQFGWRLRRERLPDGNVLFEWRCPQCWAKFKALRGLTSTGELPSTAAESPGSSRGPTTKRGKP